jgi:hypothetical protein
MTPQTEIRVKSPRCADAVRAFARELSNRTSFDLKVEAVSVPADVEFTDETPDFGTLSIAWLSKSGAENVAAAGGERGAAYFDEDEEADEPVETSMPVIRHYAATMETLGRDESLAAIVLQNMGTGGA